MNDLVFIVGSVIHFKDRKLSYSDTRSVYGPGEREKQTLATVKSIRQFVPDAKVVLIEMGTRKDIGEDLLKSIDQYIYVGSNPLVRLACNGPHKGLGEAMGIIAGLDKIKVFGQYYFKLSGRYLLNESFDLSNWKLESGIFGFKQYEASISTRLYGVPNLDQWKKLLKSCLSFLRRGDSVESAIFDKLPKDKRYSVNELGITGLVGPTGDVIKE